MSTHGFLRRGAVAVIASTTLAAAALFAFGTSASAVTPLTVAMGSAAGYSVLGGSAVTNSGLSVLDESVGLSPGPASISGFPPGVVVPPATIDQTNAAAQQAQLDLGAAYGDAAGRSVDTTTGADLGGTTLLAGVYAATGKVALSLSGPLILDGNNDPNSVFIFQTDTTLSTASASSVTLINGAQECNVFWQVGSSATLGSNSDFTGTILAATSISADSSVVVHGRALANTGAATLIADDFVTPTCDLSGTTTTAVGATTTTVAGTTTTVAGTTTTAVGATTTTVAGTTTTIAGTTTTIAGATTTIAGATTTIAGATTTIAGATTTIAGATTTIAGATTTIAGTTTTVAAATTTTDPAPTPTTVSAVTSTTIAAVGSPPTTFFPPGNRPTPVTAPTQVAGVAGAPKTDAPQPAPAPFPWSAIVVGAMLSCLGIASAVASWRRNVRLTHP